MNSSNVYNRKLFKRNARNKLSEMGGVDPNLSGIMRSSPELINAAVAAIPIRNTGQGTAPPQTNMTMAPQTNMTMTPQTNMAIAPQKNMAIGGPIDIGKAPLTQKQKTKGSKLAEGLGYGISMLANPEANNALASIQAGLGGDAVAEGKLAAIASAYDQNSPPKVVSDTITNAVGAPNTKKGLEETAEYVTGEPVPKNATINELNQKIMQASIGGAIAGPNSVGERISKAVLLGLGEAKKTEAARLAAIAAAKATAPEARNYRPPLDAYQDIYKAALADTSAILKRDDGTEMTQAEYANLTALQTIVSSYTPQQLVGTQFQGIHGGGTQPPSSSTQAPVDTKGHVAANNAAKAAGKTTYTFNGEEFNVQG